MNLKNCIKVNICLSFREQKSYTFFLAVRIWGEGQNYKNQNIKIQKERQKCFKASERQKCLLSSSTL
jgi:hypothetical protein